MWYFATLFRKVLYTFFSHEYLQVVLPQCRNKSVKSVIAFSYNGLSFTDQVLKMCENLRNLVLSYLCNIHHVSHESKAFQFELRDVCLEQHIDLKG